MTAANFAPSLKLVLVNEGDFSNHPSDPGGATMKGVTQAVYDAYRRKAGLPLRSVRKITNAELEAIYHSGYWAAIRADEMDAGVDFCLFDYAVNSGPGRAVKDLQRALGTKVDGVIGVNTLAKLHEADNEKLIADICARRLRFLKSLRTWKTFGKGWGRRVAEVEAAALAMARDEPHADLIAAPLVAEPKIQVAASMKAPEAAQAQLKTSEGQGLSMAAVGAGGEKVRQMAEGLNAHVGMDTILGRLAFVVFTLLMAIGGVLIAIPYITRLKEKGGLGGLVGSVFKT